MIIIDKNDIEKYRFAIAKYVFLKTYQDYRLLEDFKGSNCFLAERQDSRLIVSLLRMPFGLSNKQYEIVVFKQKKAKNAKKLSDDFNSMFNDYLIKALVSPTFLINEFKESPLFDDLIIDMISFHPVDGSVFKHYGDKLLKNDEYDRILGNITFVHPSECNDPFDCKCIYPSKTLTDKFRIFCTTPINNNILMWSHYSSEHKGYCFEYKKYDIVNEIIKTSFDGLGIIGEVSYSNNRPKTRPLKRTVSYTDLKFYIDATFTKYGGWSYEKEYRFVMVSDSFNNSNRFINFNVPVANVFVGCNGSPTNLAKSGKIITPVQLHESQKEYCLV